MVVRNGFQKIPKIVLLMCGDGSSEATREFAKAIMDESKAVGLAYERTIVGYAACMSVDDRGKRHAELKIEIEGLEYLGALNSAFVPGKTKKVVINVPDDLA